MKFDGKLTPLAATGSEDFEEFLQFLGDKIKLAEWVGYLGGLNQTSIISLSLSD